jgi:hypothetical protein
MANYYTAFSFEVQCSDAAADELIQMAGVAREDDDYYGGFLIDRAGLDGEDGDGVWIREDESGDIDFLSSLLHDWIMRGDHTPDAVGFEYANTCSSQRTDGFGGGAVIITEDGYDFINTGAWLAVNMKDS